MEDLFLFQFFFHILTKADIVLHASDYGDIVGVRNKTFPVSEIST